MTSSKDDNAEENETQVLIEPFSFVSQFYLANKDDVNVEEGTPIENPIALFTLLGGMSEIDADGNVISAGDVEGDENDNGNTILILGAVS